MKDGFLQKLSRPQPDPGGGAAAAFGGLLAVALLEKIVQLERRRQHHNSSMEEHWARLLSEVGSLRGDFSRLLQEDIEAYGKLQKALRGGSPEELHEAVDTAVHCPVQMMVSAKRGLLAIIDAGMWCKQHLLADLLVAAEMLGAVFQGAFHIASANVPLLAGSAEQQECRAHLSGALADGLESLDRTRKALSARQSESLPPDKNQQKTH